MVVRIDVLEIWFFICFFSNVPKYYISLIFVFFLLPGIKYVLVQLITVFIIVDNLKGTSKVLHYVGSLFFNSNTKIIFLLLPVFCDSKIVMRVSNKMCCHYFTILHLDFTIWYLSWKNRLYTTIRIKDVVIWTYMYYQALNKRKNNIITNNKKFLLITCRISVNMRI